MAYFDTYKIFNYLNKNYKNNDDSDLNKNSYLNENENENKNDLSDLEFDTTPNTNTDKLCGGKFYDSENTLHEE